jgi:hypothetical protein
MLLTLSGGAGWLGDALLMPFPYSTEFLGPCPMGHAREKGAGEGRDAAAVYI